MSDTPRTEEVVKLVLEELSPVNPKLAECARQLERECKKSFQLGMLKAAEMVRAQSIHSDFALSHDNAEEMMAQKIECAALADVEKAGKSALKELHRDKARLDWLNEAIIGSFGPARASDDEHPVHTHSFEAPVYEQEQGGLRASIDAAMAATPKGPS